MRDLLVNRKTISDASPCFVIAEMSGNHGNDLGYARELVHATKDAGADCIKLQTFKPEGMTVDRSEEPFLVKNDLWRGRNLYDLYRESAMPWEWQAELKELAESLGLEFLSTPFDRESADFLSEIEVSFFKVASCELTDLPLIRHIGKKGKPTLISTGAGNLEEINEAVAAYREYNDRLCLLKCSSVYPAIHEDMNLATIADMKQRYGTPVGLSDHSRDSVSALVAVSLGAKVIEKHICLSRSIPTIDSGFSLEPEEFKTMVRDIRNAEKAIGVINYEPVEREQESRRFRRSLIAIRDIEVGERIDDTNMKVLRPAVGLEPRYYDDVIGTVAAKKISYGEAIRWESIARE